MRRALGWGLLLAAGLAAAAPDLQRDHAARQLDHLERALDAGAARRMQLLFPEGFVFTWVLYGLAALQLAQELAVDDPARAALMRRANTALAALASPAGRAPFDASMAPRYGVFHAGWSLLLRGRRVCLDRTLEPDPEGYRQAVDELAAAFDARLPQTPFLASYRGQAWAADSVAAMAALALSDRCDQPRHAALRARWLAAARTRTVPRLGALPHAVAADDGRPIGSARGSSLALMSLLLVDIDPLFALAQYQVLRTHFLDRPAPGLVGFREYPRGTEGLGDIDSGPLLMGLGGPATVVGAGAARANGDAQTAATLLAMAEVYGMPTEDVSGRTYLGGSLPIGEAFLAWARSVPVAESAGSQSGMRACWLLLAVLPSPALTGQWLWVHGRSCLVGLAAAMLQTVVSQRRTGALPGATLPGRSASRHFTILTSAPHVQIRTCCPDPHLAAAADRDPADRLQQPHAAAGCRTQPTRGIGR